MSIKEKVRKHVKEYKNFYAGFGVGFGLTVITYAIVRHRSQSISRGIPVTAKRGIPVLREKVGGDGYSQSTIGVLGEEIVIKNSTLNTVSYFSANRQGPPSWVVRCNETGEVYTSQNKASEDLGVPSSEISRQLNGSIDNARGYTFERICMAA